MRKLITLTLCFVIVINFFGCSRSKNLSENIMAEKENQTKWAEIYQITLNSYLEQDTALNENIDFIAIDLSTLEFANDYDKNIIVIWFEKNHVSVKNINLEGLKTEGLFDGRRISDGVFLKIDNVTEMNKEIIIEGMKYRSALGANWFRTKWLLNNNGIWEFVETVMTSIS
jgi:hypothetical protein